MDGAKAMVLDNLNSDSDENRDAANVILGLEVVPHFGSIFRHKEAVPDSLVGARIVRLGTVEASKNYLEGGGLVIDYQTGNDERVRRILLEFTEEGLWASSPSALRLFAKRVSTGG
jgi:hypothetical protein